jgi:tetratricopeptide (TPR) repeat protein
VTIQQPAVIDFGAALKSAAESQGFLSPEAVAELKERLARAETALDAVRIESPELAPEVDGAIRAVNARDPGAARAAFAEANAAIDAREADMRRERARLKYAEATLLYPFEASKAEPLLAEAAVLAQTEAWFWIECGRARVDLGRLADALAAFREAERVARAQGLIRDVSVALDGIGDVRVAQGDLPGALDAFDEGLAIARNLAARDKGNAGWARDVWVSYWKLAQVDPGNAGSHWAEVVARMEDMSARGILAPVDLPYLDTARANLAAAQATR